MEENRIDIKIDEIMRDEMNERMCELATYKELGAHVSERKKSRRQSSPCGDVLHAKNSGETTYDWYRFVHRRKSFKVDSFFRSTIALAAGEKPSSATSETRKGGWEGEVMVVVSPFFFCQ